MQESTFYWHVQVYQQHTLRRNWKDWACRGFQTFFRCFAVQTMFRQWKEPCFVSGLWRGRYSLREICSGRNDGVELEIFLYFYASCIFYAERTINSPLTVNLYGFDDLKLVYGVWPDSWKSTCCKIHVMSFKFVKKLLKLWLILGRNVLLPSHNPRSLLLAIFFYILKINSNGTLKNSPEINQTQAGPSAPNQFNWSVPSPSTGSALAGSGIWVWSFGHFSLWHVRYKNHVT